MVEAGRSMRLFVGVLYSGENEYDECLNSIDDQTYQNFELHKFEYLPKLEAHSRLYHSFLDQKDQYDLLIKIDADMVLTRPELFQQIVDKFDQNSDIDVLGIAIWDFFSGGYINGLNSYRNTVSWELDPKNVNADVVIVDQEKYVFDKTDLAPAAFHCKNPSKLQAFHFGVHRGIKVFAPRHSSSHWQLLEKTWQNFLKTSDVRIGLAILGAELVYTRKFSQVDVDYTNPKLAGVFNQFQEMTSKEIKKEIIKLRMLNFGFLPGDLRRRTIRCCRLKNLERSKGRK